LRGSRVVIAAPSWNRNSSAILWKISGNGWRRGRCDGPSLRSLAGAEIGVFVGKDEVTHRYAELENLSDEELLTRRRETVLLEHEAKADATPEDG
jgi:hypothetical protein